MLTVAKLTNVTLASVGARLCHWTVGLFSTIKVLDFEHFEFLNFTLFSTAYLLYSINFCLKDFHSEKSWRLNINKKNTKLPSHKKSKRPQKKTLKA